MMLRTLADAGTLRRMQRDIDRVLIDRRRIAERIDELGREIGRDLDDLSDDVEIVLVPVLTGAITFVADLIRRLPQKIRINLLSASSYQGRTTRTTGEPIIGDLPEELRDQHVIIVDDILDSGTTIRRIRAEIAEHEPRSLRACVLLRKNLPSARETPCEYVGFDIPDEFVIGFGLDYNGYYRNLPDICVLKKEAL